jgi:hypothetical protein
MRNIVVSSKFNSPDVGYWRLTAKDGTALVPDHIVFVTPSQPDTRLSYAREALARLGGRISLTPVQQATFRRLAFSNGGVVVVTADEFIALAQGDGKQVLELAKNKASNLHSLWEGEPAQ